MHIFFSLIAVLITMSGFSSYWENPAGISLEPANFSSQVRMSITLEQASQLYNFPPKKFKKCGQYFTVEAVGTPLATFTPPPEKDAKLSLSALSDNGRWLFSNLDAHGPGVEHTESCYQVSYHFCVIANLENILEDFWKNYNLKSDRKSGEIKKENPKVIFFQKPQNTALELQIDNKFLRKVYQSVDRIFSINIPALSKRPHYLFKVLAGSTVDPIVPNEDGEETTYLSAVENPRGTWSFKSGDENAQTRYDFKIVLDVMPFIHNTIRTDPERAAMLSPFEI